MTYVYLADIRCLQCGRDLETVKVDSPMSMPRLGRASRCQACGGQPMFTGEVVRRWQGEPIVIEPKPLGRPPAPRRSWLCRDREHERCTGQRRNQGCLVRCECRCHVEDPAIALEAFFATETRVVGGMYGD